MRTTQIRIRNDNANFRYKQSKELVLVSQYISVYCSTIYKCYNAARFSSAQYSAVQHSAVILMTASHSIKGKKLSYREDLPQQLAGPYVQLYMRVAGYTVSAGRSRGRG
jgi:hypothetical protein